MKIDSSFQSPQPPPREAAAAKAGPATPAQDFAGPSSVPSSSSPAPLAHGDAAHLSAAALQASASSALPEARLDKVAGVQQALAGGSYAVSASDVADRLIDHLLRG